MKTIKSRLYGTFFAGVAALAALILSACTFALDPVNAITDAFRFADTNVGILKVVNGAQNGAVLYGVRVIMPDKSLSEYNFETGLLPGNSREYRLPAQITYSVKFGNGKGWSKNPQSVYFAKDETFTVTFDGTEEISIDLSGAKGKLTVFNSIPDTKGEYVIENIRISSVEGTSERENIVFYFYTAGGIHNGEKPDFDVLPGDYWVRAQIKDAAGKLSKWSIPAHVGSYSATDKDKFDVSDAPGKVTVSADRGGIAVFNEKVLEGGQAGGNVIINTPDFPSIPDNSLLDDNGKETPNISGKVDPDSKPVKSIKVEKLGFPTADKNGVTGSPVYPYGQKDKAVEEGKIVKTTIYDQAITAGGEWKLALAEAGWYLLSFSTDGKTFSKAFPVRLEDKNGNGKIDPEEVEPGVIPPYNDDDSTWTDKQGVAVGNDTPAEGGPVYKKDANGNWVPDGNKTLTSAEAQKPITDIKVYNLDGSLYGHYRNRYGLPIYNGKEWIITPALPPGDYLVSLSDDNGSTWTHPPFPLHVDGNGDGSVDYDKTHPFWDGKMGGKPGPELTSPTDPIWTGPDINWRPGTEINPGTPIYVVVPSEPALDTVPTDGDKELADVGTPPAEGSQLDIEHLTASDLGKINYIKLNSFATSARAYRIIDLRKITYTGTESPGGIPKGKRLSLVGFDFSPGMYYVYLSENGHNWKKYKAPVTIPAPWTTDNHGNVVYAGADEIETVSYKTAGTDENWEVPSFTDTDGDGFPDDWENEHGYDPNDRTDPDPNGDDDNDGLTNREEYDKGTDPKNFDTDGDGYNDKDDPDPLDSSVPGGGGTTPGGGGTTPGGGGGDDGGGTNVPKKGFLVIQNLIASTNISSITIRQPYTGGSPLVDGAITYDAYSVNIAHNGYLFLDIPVTVEGTPDNPYQVMVINSANTTAFYKVTIEHAKFTYIAFEGLKDGSGTQQNPIVVNPDTPPPSGGGVPGVPGGGGGDGGGGTTPPPDNPGNDDNKDLTVIGGGTISGSEGPMQPGPDPIGTWTTAAEGNNLFDRNWASYGTRTYWSGQVQPYLPKPSASVQFPEGGDGTKQNMNGRGYFNFRFHWDDSNWGIGYLALQKLQRRGTSSTKDPVGDIIVLLDVRADMGNSGDRGAGTTQARLGMIYNSANAGSIKGEDRSFNDWRRNWLGLRDEATGWQLNVKADGRIDREQPVYRAGSYHFPVNRDAAWSTDKSNKPVNKEFGAHRAYNNPGRLYTTGVTYTDLDGKGNPQTDASRLYAALGAGFEAGEYRVTLYKGYDSLHKTATVGDARQVKMYRYYKDTFDITIYQGVVTTAIYRAALDRAETEGAFAYTPIPQAAFGRLVVLNNPPNNDYTVNAILLDKPGYYKYVNESNVAEVHRY
ncbi:MAG: thrombospondin type 3 repeat-containing protein, partial [Treponema sp.]|nr:thrombospondin type 3 repeat-containing protein [Treponema sp.]